MLLNPRLSNSIWIASIFAGSRSANGSTGRPLRSTTSNKMYPQPRSWMSLRTAECVPCRAASGFQHALNSTRSHSTVRRAFTYQRNHHAAVTHEGGGGAPHRDFKNSYKFRSLSAQGNSSGSIYSRVLGETYELNCANRHRGNHRQSVKAK